MMLLKKLFWDPKKDRTKYKVFLVFSLLYALFLPALSSILARVGISNCGFSSAFKEQVEIGTEQPLIFFAGVALNLSLLYGVSQLTRKNSLWVNSLLKNTLLAGSLAIFTFYHVYSDRVSWQCSLERAPTGAALNKAFISVGGIICLIMWVGLVLGINFIAIARVQDARKISDCQ